MDPIGLPADVRAESLYGKPEEPSTPSSDEPAVEETPQEPEKAESGEVDTQQSEPENKPEVAAQEASEDSDEPDADDKPDEQPAEQSADDDSDSEESYIQTIEELAEHLETDPGFIEGLKVKQKVNGKEVEVSIADALATYRKTTAADQVLTEAKEKRNAMLEEAGQREAEVGENLAVATALLQDMEQSFSQLVGGQDLEQLRRDDPQEWTARKQEIREKQEKIADLKQKAAQAYRDMIGQANERVQQARIAALPQEQEILFERVPEWRDEAKASKEREEVLKYMHSQGFSESEVSVAGFSGRALSLAVKAMRYDKLQGKKSDIMQKKVAKIPKVVKAGSKSEDSKPQQQPKDRASLLYGS